MFRYDVGVPGRPDAMARWSEKTIVPDASTPSACEGEGVRERGGEGERERGREGERV